MNKIKLIRIFAKNSLLTGTKPLWTRVRRLLWAAALLLPAFATRADVVVSLLHPFGIVNDPSPFWLVQGSDGNFYGLTWGGTNNAGSVVKISTNGVLTTLYSFTGGNDGSNPSGLVQGGDGNLYGTTRQRGTNNAGTVFRIATNGTLTSLYSFTGSNDGAIPNAGLVQGRDGFFYGATEAGGAYLGNLGQGNGTIFKINSNGVFTSLYSFTGGNDGGVPTREALLQGNDGDFYGSTIVGGNTNVGSGTGYGTVFKISANGVLTTLYSFTDGTDGFWPSGSLVQGRDGNLYGATSYGGASYFGVVFKLSTNGVLTILHSFTNGGDGSRPSGLAQGSDGYFYGFASGGTNPAGIMFRISTNGVLTSLYSFTGGNDGADPQAGRVQGSDGNFYGTTSAGGINGSGTLFKISTSGVLTTLWPLTGNNDGEFPQAALVPGAAGNFYGTTSGGGTNGGHGTVFKISINGSLTSLYSFTGSNDGGSPRAALVQGSDGDFYGTTYYGGTNDLAWGGFGTVFKISPNGLLATLYSFSGNNGYPNDLVQGSDGNFYGTTQSGYNSLIYGSVFKIGTNGVLTTLHSFSGGNDGYYPQAALVQGNDGYFYGTTQGGGTNYVGTVFKISTNGMLTTLYSFGSIQDSNGFSLDGIYPSAALVQGSDGYFYGTTEFGGIASTGIFPPSSYGTVFKISTNGVLTTLYSFGAIQSANGLSLDGSHPQATLMQGSDGYSYGTTQSGGADNAGTAFKITTNGAFTTLYSFTSGNDGSGPNGLVQGGKGNFYGTTSSFGPGGAGIVGAGTIFRLTIEPEFQALALTNGTLNLTWSTEAGGIYQLQASASLSTPNWTNLGSPVTATNGTFTFTDSVTNTPQRFYRVSLAP